MAAFVVNVVNLSVCFCVCACACMCACVCEMVKDFTYLGSNLSSDGETTCEVNSQIAKASKAFWLPADVNIIQS